MAKSIAKEQSEEGADHEMYELTGQQIMDALDRNADEKVDFEEYAMDGRDADDESMYGEEGGYYGEDGIPEAEQEQDDDIDEGHDLSLDDLTSDHDLK